MKLSSCAALAAFLHRFRYDLLLLPYTGLLILALAAALLLVQSCATV